MSENKELLENSMPQGQAMKREVGTRYPLSFNTYIAQASPSIQHLVKGLNQWDVDRAGSVRYVRALRSEGHFIKGAVYRFDLDDTPCFCLDPYQPNKWEFVVRDSKQIRFPMDFLNAEVWQIRPGDIVTRGVTGPLGLGNWIVLAVEFIHFSSTHTRVNLTLKDSATPKVENISTYDDVYTPVLGVSPVNLSGDKIESVGEILARDQTLQEALMEHVKRKLYKKEEIVMTNQRELTVGFDAAETDADTEMMTKRRQRFIELSTKIPETEKQLAAMKEEFKKLTDR